jgi:hypothetical protein
MVMYTDHLNMFSYTAAAAARGLFPSCMTPHQAGGGGAAGYPMQTQVFGATDGDNKPPASITFHGKRFTRTAFCHVGHACTRLINKIKQS